MIVVSKRTDYTGRTYWKNERRKLPKVDRAAAEYQRQRATEWIVPPVDR
jgi:hypothetical protein